MTNVLLQMRVNPDDIHLTAVTTPFGLYEWIVMPMGCQNALVTHQRRMCAALRWFIGKIHHVYLNNIIIWSLLVAKHLRNVEKIMKAMQEHSLFCSTKKTELFCTMIQFLGNIIFANGAEADPSKIKSIARWPIPKKAKDVCTFLGLICYMAAFLPRLAEHTAVLLALTMKEAENKSLEWEDAQQ